MAEILQDEAQGTLESTTIWVNRTAATVKGGRRFSFCALVAVGDRNGKVGLGYGKAPGVPSAIEKAQKEAKKKLRRIELNRGTVPHEVTGRFCSSKVRLIPASPGTGVIAGGTVRAVLELAGVKDCLSKSYGSTNKINLARAALEGLLSLESRETIAEHRGIELPKTLVDEKIEIGERYAPSGAAEESGKAKAPVNVMDEQARKGGRRGGRSGGGRGPRTRGHREAAAAESAPQGDDQAAREASAQPESAENTQTGQGVAETPAETQPQSEPTEQQDQTPKQ